MFDLQVLSQICPKQLFQSIMDNAPLLISAKDLDGNVIMANRHFELLDGYDAENFVGKNVYELFPKEIADALWRNDLAAIKSEHQITAEESVKHKDGTIHTYQTVKFPLQDQNGKTCAVCAISYDITAAKEAEKRCNEDELTQLYNRRYFNHIFTEEMNRAKRVNRSFCLMLLDLDRFKFFNDTYGHDSGDKALAQAGKIMRETCHRAGDFCFRIGGEEFAIICAIDNPDNALDLAELVRKHIEEMQIPHELNEPYGVLTCSVGVATCAPFESTPTRGELYSLADKALYRAKGEGRNTIAHSAPP